MSANNYSVCPKCKAAKMREQSRYLKLADESYGKIPQAEYQAIEAKATAPFHLELTLAEYYEIGIGQTGLFSVDYSSGCAECSFKFTFKTTEKAMQ